MVLYYCGNYGREIKGNELILPAKIAQALDKRNNGRNYVAAIGCIDDYKFISIEDQLTNSSSISKKGREFYLDDLELDKNKITLTKKIKDFLDLDKIISVMGMHNQFELWNPKDIKQGVNYSDKYYQVCFNLIL